MRIANLAEMTINVGLAQADERLEPTFDYISQHGVHIGDQDGFPITKATHGTSILYGIKSDGKIVTVLAGKETDRQFQLQVVHTLHQYRKLNHAIRLLWFVKNQEGKQIIDYGAQTADGIDFIKGVDRSGRFTVYWYNTQTKERVNYSGTRDGPDNAPYRGHQQTAWRIVIEGEQEPTFERYAKDQPGGAFGAPYYKLWT